MRNFMVLGLLLTLGVAACSSGGSGGSGQTAPPPPPAGIVVKGVVSDAFVDNATLTAFEVKSNGTLGPCVPPPSGTGCATATSNADGSYSLTIGTGWTGPVLLESTGGSYTDTVTGQSVSIPGGLTLSAFLPSVSAGSNPVAQVTGWTTMAAQLALQAMASGSSASAAATGANSAVQNSFAFVDSASLTTQLLNLTQANCGTAAQDQAGFDVSLLGAGLEELASDNKVTSAALLLAMVEDLVSDGMLDGLEAGVPINVPLASGSGSVALTTIYGSSLAKSLEAGIVAFQSSVQNVCKATQSPAMAAKLPTVSATVTNATYNYTFNGSVQGLPSGPNVSVTLEYLVNLVCPNDMLVGSGEMLKPFLAQNGTFSAGIAGSPNSYAPLNYNNACGRNTGTLKIYATTGVSCGIGTSASGPFTDTLTLSYSSSDGGNHNAATVSPTISCTALTPPTFRVGGVVSGLPAGASLVLSDTVNGDSVTVTANGAFTLPALIGSGANYNVTASLSTCTVSNGSGAINGANVTNVGVFCTSGGGGGGITSGLNAPKGIVWGNKLLYVPNSGANQVLVLSEVLNGSNAVTGFKQMATITQDLNDPVSAALDSAGNLYVANQGNNTVSVYNTASSYQEITAGGHALLSGGHLDQPSSVTVDSLDNVYVTNSAGNSISVYQPVTAGNPSAGFNEPAFSPLTRDGNSNAFTAPQVIADASVPSAAEYIVVGLAAGSTDTLLIYKSPLTDLTLPAFVLEAAGCNTPSGPTGIGLFADTGSPLSSAIYVSTSTNNDVFDYGALTLLAGHGLCVAPNVTNGTAMNLPSGVAVDPYDNVFVANAGTTGTNANTIGVYAGATFGSSQAPYFIYSPTAGLTCGAAPSPKGGGAQPYDNETYCVRFSGATDTLFTFTGTLTFTTPLVPGAISNCAYYASGTVSVGGTGNTGVVTCTGTTDASGNLHVSDSLGNSFTGTFSTPSATSVSGTYAFGEFGPGGGVASGTFSGTEQ